MTTNALAKLSPASFNVGTGNLLEIFLADKKPATVRVYRQDLAHLAALAGATDVASALERLLRLERGEANAVAFQYRASMVEAGLAPATVNRRLATLRSIVKMARTVGLCTWDLDVTNVKQIKVRDSRGPTREQMVKILDACHQNRDRAIVRLLYDVALRRGEVVAIDLDDVLMDETRLPVAVLIVQKGHREKSRVDLPKVTGTALRDWLEERGAWPGPLFVALDCVSRGSRLSDTSVYRLVRRLGDLVGVRARPHGLRHAAITEAVRATNGNAMEVQRFSRHADLRTVSIYVDRVQNPAVKTAERIAL